MGYTEIANENNFGFIAVADTPADEVGVRLASKGIFDEFSD